MEAWFLSDIHLKKHDERNGEILLRFLHSLRDKDPAQTRLFLLGDIFDLWIGGSGYFAKKFEPQMRALRELRERGMEIVYIEGNHDVHVDGYFRKKLGIDVFVEAQYYEIDGLTVRVEHGDLINLEDEAYLRYRAIIRNPFVRPLKDFAPGRFWDWLGSRASKKSRAQSSHFRVQNEEHLVRMIRAHAERAYRAERKFDLIVSGHMHVFDDFTFTEDGKRIRSVNLGSWFEEKVRVLRLRDRQAEWVEI